MTKTCFLLMLIAVAYTCAVKAQRVANASFVLIDTGDLATDKGCSRGIAWGDLDSDGLPDAVVVNCNNQNIFLYLNEGNGYFRRITEGVVAETPGYFESVSIVDYDNDGDLDIFVTSLNNHPDYLFRNNGKAVFESVKAGVLTSDSTNSPGSCWCDYDNDGDIDVYVVTNGNAEDILYNNSGKGTFERVSKDKFPYSIADGRTCSWADIDADGDFDIYVGNFVEVVDGVRQNARNNMYINVGHGRFKEAPSGPQTIDRGRTYGSSFADFDNDGDPDLMVTNIGASDSSVLYVNDGQGKFHKLSPGQSGIVSGKPSKGHTWGDFNNDGFLDLFVANGTENIPDSLLNDDIYYGTSAGKLKKVIDIYPAIGGKVSAGTAWADADGDGDLDLFVCNWRNNNERNAWYINKTSGTQWIAIALRGTSSNRMGIGAKVQLRVEVNGKEFIQTRWMFPQTGFGSQNENLIHFGLPAGNKNRSLRILWPSGRNQLINSVSLNRKIQVTEPL